MNLANRKTYDLLIDHLMDLHSGINFQFYQNQINRLKERQSLIDRTKQNFQDNEFKLFYTGWKGGWISVMMSFDGEMLKMGSDLSIKTPVITSINGESNQRPERDIFTDLNNVPLRLIAFDNETITLQSGAGISYQIRFKISFDELDRIKSDEKSLIQKLESVLNNREERYRIIREREPDLDVNQIRHIDDIRDYLLNHPEQAEDDDPDYLSFLQNYEIQDTNSLYEYMLKIFRPTQILKLTSKDLMRFASKGNAELDRMLKLRLNTEDNTLMYLTQPEKATKYSIPVYIGFEYAGVRYPVTNVYPHHVIRVRYSFDSITRDHRINPMDKWSELWDHMFGLRKGYNLNATDLANKPNPSDVIHAGEVWSKPSSITKGYMNIRVRTAGWSEFNNEFSNILTSGHRKEMEVPDEMYKDIALSFNSSEDHLLNLTTFIYRADWSKWDEIYQKAISDTDELRRKVKASVIYSIRVFRMGLNLESLSTYKKFTQYLKEHHAEYGLSKENVGRTIQKGDMNNMIKVLFLKDIDDIQKDAAKYIEGKPYRYKQYDYKFNYGHFLEHKDEWTYYDGNDGYVIGDHPILLGYIKSWLNYIDLDNTYPLTIDGEQVKETTHTEIEEYTKMGKFRGLKCYDENNRNNETISKFKPYQDIEIGYDKIWCRSNVPFLSVNDKRPSANPFLLGKNPLDSDLIDPSFIARYQMLDKEYYRFRLERRPRLAEEILKLWNVLARLSEIKFMVIGRVDYCHAGTSIRAYKDNINGFPFRYNPKGDDYKHLYVPMSSYGEFMGLGAYNQMHKFLTPDSSSQYTQSRLHQHLLKYSAEGQYQCFTRTDTIETPREVSNHSAIIQLIQRRCIEDNVVEEDIRKSLSWYNNVASVEHGIVLTRWDGRLLARFISIVNRVMNCELLKIGKGIVDYPKYTDIDDNKAKKELAYKDDVDIAPILYVDETVLPSRDMNIEQFYQIVYQTALLHREVMMSGYVDVRGLSFIGKYMAVEPKYNFDYVGIVLGGSSTTPSTSDTRPPVRDEPRPSHNPDYLAWSDDHLRGSWNGRTGLRPRSINRRYDPDDIAV